MSKDQVVTWMEELEKLMKENSYSPYLIFNYDETMVQPGTPRLKVLTKAKENTPVVATSNNMEHITFGICVSAAGAAIKPLVVLPLKTLIHCVVLFSTPLEDDVIGFAKPLSVLVSCAVLFTFNFDQFLFYL